MRPHVELIQQSDLCWHPAELHGGTGRVMQRNYHMTKKMVLAQQNFPLKPHGIDLVDIMKRTQNGLCLKVK